MKTTQDSEDILRQIGSIQRFDLSDPAYGYWTLFHCASLSGSTVRKHRPAIAVTLVIGSILLVGSVVSTWLALAATSARQAEQIVSLKAQRDERSVRHRLAEELFNTDEPGMGVAQLVKLVRDDRQDSVAMERLVSAIVCRDFPEKIAPVQAPDPRVRIGEEARFISGDRKILLPVPASGRLASWDADSGRSSWVTGAGENWREHVAISPDSSLAAIQVGKQVKVHEIPAGTERHVFDLMGGEREKIWSKVWSMCFDATGRTPSPEPISGTASARPPITTNWSSIVRLMMASSSTWMGSRSEAKTCPKAEKAPASPRFAG